jgi:hypothetical protein
LGPGFLSSALGLGRRRGCSVHRVQAVSWIELQKQEPLSNGGSSRL